jgi:hypothetical protein
VGGFEAAHVCAKARSHILLAEHVIEELCELGGKEIARPFGGDCLQCFDGAQVVVGMPERERSMQSALPRTHRQRFARMEMDGGLRARVVSLAV